jgi:heme oxygenase
MDGLIEKLRIASRPVHQQVEQTILLKRLVAGSIDPTQYRMLIQTMYAVCSDFFQYFQQNLQQTPFAKFIPHACRLVELKQDLLLLGLTDFYTPKQLINFKQRPEAALGAMYVLLGSANGAQFLTRAIDQNLNKQIQEARYFFTHQSEARSVIWADFVEILGSSVFGHEQQSNIVESAINTFCFIAKKLDDVIEVEHG